MSDMPTDVEITRAQRLGSLAAKAGRSFDDCPYPADQRVLRSRWSLAYADTNPDALVEPDEEPDGPDAEGPAEDDAEAKARRSRQLALLETRVAGHDVTPGHDELHHWWTKGPGLARWIGSPHQYTTLHAELVKATKGKLPPGEIDRMAAAWVHEVTGFWPGSDMHRVLEGHKPRGSRIGPG